MTSTRPLAIGVIGGMGPAATFDFCSKLTALAPARIDQDHPRLLVDCDPTIPDRNAFARGDGPSPGPILARKAQALEAAGAALIVMPCNTAHAHADAIRAAIKVAFIDMIAASVAQAHGAKAVGVLAADGCLAATLYQTALARTGAAPILLSRADQVQFMEVLYAIKAGALTKSERTAMRGFASLLVAAGAEVLIAGCTEVPLVLQASDITVPLVCSSSALAQATLAAAYGA